MLKLRQAWRRYRRTTGLRREILTLALCLVLGLGLMPILIWLVGSRTLGPYYNGGVLALWRDYLGAVVHGSAPYLAVAAGPYCAVWLWRTLRWSLRR